MLTLETQTFQDHCDPMKGGVSFIYDLQLVEAGKLESRSGKLKTALFEPNLIKGHDMN